MRAVWQSEKQVVEGIQNLKTELENLKHQAETAERSGDYGKVAEIRYGKMKEAELELESLNSELMEKQSNGALMFKPDGCYILIA